MRCNAVRIASANFWLDGDKLSLRGEVVSNPVNKSPRAGHLDIEIIFPDETNRTCFTTRARLTPCHARKTYSIALDALPGY